MRDGVCNSGPHLTHGRTGKNLTLSHDNCILWSLDYWLFGHSPSCFKTKHTLKCFCHCFSYIYIVLFILDLRNFPHCREACRELQLPYCLCDFSFLLWNPGFICSLADEMWGFEESFALSLFCSFLSVLTFPQEKYWDFPPLKSPSGSATGNHSMKVGYFF